MWADKLHSAMNKCDVIGNSLLRSEILHFDWLYAVVRPLNHGHWMDKRKGMFYKHELYSTSVKQKMDTRLSHWTFLLVFSTACGLITIPLPSGAEHCSKIQAAELGKAGRINCSLPEGFNDIYWFDNISISSPFVIRFQPNEERVKSGPGFESGDYDVLEDGSLKITKVTLWHERTYRVIIFKQGSQTPDNLLISLSVTASPVDDLPMIPCHNCHQEYYYSAMQGEILSCSFNATRPPVQLEWFKKFGDVYEHLEMQQFSTTENRNGTFNSLATIHLLKDSTSFIQLLVCTAAWPLLNWRRERKIFLDFSSNISFSGVTPKVQYMEIDRYAKIQCGQPPTVYVVWKRILPNRGPKIVGFLSRVMTETINDIPDVEVSTEGSLIFASPRVQHEGMYVCIYGDGRKEEIQMTSLEVLIPPSLPYIQITGCDGVSHRCVIRENSTKELTCAVYGARPNVTLEWIAEDEDEIAFFNHKTVFKKRGETFDTVLSVEYKVSQDVMCGKEILIKCYLYGPLSYIVKAESTALVIPASCRENEGKEEHGWDGTVMVWLVLSVLLTVTVTVVLIICRKLGTQTNSTTSTSYSGVSTRDPEGYIFNTRPRIRSYYICDHEDIS